jgi:hypothetical protein
VSTIRQSIYDAQVAKLRAQFSGRALEQAISAFGEGLEVLPDEHVMFSPFGACSNCSRPLVSGQVTYCSPQCANEEWSRDKAAEAESNARKLAGLRAAGHYPKES